MPYRPRVAVTLGDPGGIGPEVVARALARPEVRSALRPLVIGSLEALAVHTARLDLSVTFHPAAPRREDEEGNSIPVLDPEPRLSGFRMGDVEAANGRAAHAWIVEGARLALAGEVEALCTAPISKEAMFAAGFRFPGHTELLAELCGGCEVRMMLEGGGLHAVLQTIHVPLATVPGLLSTGRIVETLRIMDRWGRRYMTPAPRIAVCGLNPHAGEGGHFGREDLDIIRPAVEAMRAEGMEVSGPHPADTVFHRAREGAFDMVLAMYHDQALIPVKTLDFHRGVNVTLGLPIIRTSPDHGTAFDLAGRGAASESSMVSALLRGADLARRSRAAE